MTLDRNKLKELGQLAREKKAFIRTSDDAVCDGARISPYPELDDILAELEAAEQNAADNAVLADISEILMGHREASAGEIKSRVEYLSTAEERVRELTQHPTKCPKGHPVPYQGCKYCGMLGDFADANRVELIEIIFKWHDAFYREENRANAEHSRLSVMETALRDANEDLAKYTNPHPREGLTQQTCQQHNPDEVRENRVAAENDNG